MDRNVILDKSRKEHRDEREEQVRDKSLKWTLITMVVLSAIFSYIRGTKGESMMDLSVIVCGSVCISFLYRYIKTKAKTYLFLAMICFAAALLSLVRYVMGY